MPPPPSMEILRFLSTLHLNQWIHPLQHRFSRPFPLTALQFPNQHQTRPLHTMELSWGFNIQTQGSIVFPTSFIEEARSASFKQTGCCRVCSRRIVGKHGVDLGPRRTTYADEYSRVFLVSIYLLMPFFLCESSPSSANKFTFTDSWYPIISCQREITYEIVELSSRAGSKCLQTCI